MQTFDHESSLSCRTASADDGDADVDCSVLPSCPSSSSSYNPVCGTDGVGYDSACALRAIACATGRADTLRVDYVGACRKRTADVPTKDGGYAKVEAR